MLREFSVEETMKREGVLLENNNKSETGGYTFFKKFCLSERGNIN